MGNKTLAFGLAIHFWICAPVVNADDKSWVALKNSSTLPSASLKKYSREFDDGSKEPSVIFASHRNKKNGQTTPDILVNSKNEWQAWQAAAEERTLPGASDFWVFAGRMQNKYWGITDFYQGDPWYAFTIYFSDDEGKSWKRSELQKSNFSLAAAPIIEFSMNKNGEGRLIQKLNNSDNGEQEEDFGIYTYSTKDWGMTWSQPMKTSLKSKIPKFENDLIPLKSCKGKCSVGI